MLDIGLDRPTPERSACANIGPRERRKRFRFGVIALVVGVAIASALVFSGVDRAWRIILFLPFALAGIGFFQAYEKT